MELLTICFSAFISVFLLLSVLALSMRLIITFFPEKESSFDSSIIAVITSTYKSTFPNSIINKIEEEK